MISHWTLLPVKIRFDSYIAFVAHVVSTAPLMFVTPYRMPEEFLPPGTHSLNFGTRKEEKGENKSVCMHVLGGK